MGYAGYVPTKYAPPPATKVQAALRAVESLESLEIIGKLTRNVVVSPAEEKFRKIRLGNAKIHTMVIETEGALAALLALGWEHEEGDPQTLVVPKSRHFTMVQVRAVEDAKDELKKRQRERQLKATRGATTAEKNAELRAQLEADRRERAAAEPVTRSSVAQALPGGSGAGAVGRVQNGDDCC